MNAAPKTKTILTGIFLLIALLITVTLISSAIYIFSNQSAAEFEKAVIISRLLFWVSLLIIYWYAIKIERQSLLLYNATKKNIGFYVLSVIVLVVSTLILASIVGLFIKISGLYSGQSKKYLLFIKLFKNNNLLLIFTTLTAGITEELLFRGYLLSRLQLLVKNRYVPIILSSFLFGLAHVGYGTIQNIIGPMFIGLLFAFYYDRYKTIVPVIIAHFLYDLLVVLIAIHYYYPSK